MSDEQPQQDEEKDVEAQYQDMLTALDLKSIRLINSSTTRNPDLEIGASAINVEKTTESAIKEDNKKLFRFIEHIELKAVLKDSEQEIFTLSGSFLLNYQSPIEVDSILLEMFASRNLSIHSWPYLREFVQSMSTRMGLPPVLLPLLLPRKQAE